VRRNIARRWHRFADRIWQPMHPPQSPSHVTDTSGLSAAAVLVDAAGANLLVAQSHAASAYIPQRYDGTVDVIWAEGRPNVKRTDPTHSWARVAADVHVHQIVAHHIGLITNDLPKLAEVIRAILDRPSR
jgi:hypothetical protein